MREATWLSIKQLKWCSASWSVGSLQVNINKIWLEREREREKEREVGKGICKVREGLGWNSSQSFRVYHFFPVCYSNFINNIYFFQYSINIPSLQCVLKQNNFSFLKPYSFLLIITISLGYGTQNYKVICLFIL